MYSLISLKKYIWLILKAARTYISYTLLKHLEYGGYSIDVHLDRFIC